MLLICIFNNFYREINSILTHTNVEVVKLPLRNWEFRRWWWWWWWLTIDVRRWWMVTPDRFEFVEGWTIVKRGGSLSSKRRLVDDVVELVETDDVEVIVKELNKVSNGSDEDIDQGRNKWKNCFSNWSLHWIDFNRQHTCHRSADIISFQSVKRERKKKHVRL